MRVRSSWFLAMLVVGVPSIGGGATSVVAQAGDEAVRNPYIGDPDAIEQGKTFFRLSCALCHGLDARGTFRGPDLTAGRWIHGSSDADIFRTVTDGIAGTEMAASQFSDVENWMTIAYVRSLGAASRPPLAGDPPCRGANLLRAERLLAMSHDRRSRWPTGTRSLSHWGFAKPRTAEGSDPPTGREHQPAIRARQRDDR